MYEMLKFFLLVLVGILSLYAGVVIVVLSLLYAHWFFGIVMGVSSIVTGAIAINTAVNDVINVEERS